MTSRAMPAGYGEIYGEGWHDGTPEGAAAFMAYTNQNPFPQLGDGGYTYVPPTSSSYRPYMPTGSGYGPGAATAGGGGGGGNPPVGASQIYDLFNLDLVGGAVGGSSSGSSGICDFAPGGAIGKYLCEQAQKALQNRSTGGLVGKCQQGYHPDPKTGECVIDGLGDYLPGDIGKADRVWTPVNGRYGAGVTPGIVQSQKRFCPSGYVLGKDGVCYDRLAKTNRAHNPGTKPFLTGGDMSALRRAHQLQKTIGKLNRRFGKKVAKVCGPRKKR